MTSIALILCAVFLASTANANPMTPNTKSEWINNQINDAKKVIETAEQQIEQMKKTEKYEERQSNVFSECVKQTESVSAIFSKAVNKVNEVINNDSAESETSECLQLIDELAVKMNSTVNNVMNCSDYNLVNSKAHQIRDKSIQYVEKMKLMVTNLSTKATACSTNINFTKDNVIACTQMAGIELVISAAKAKLQLAVDQRKFQFALNPTSGTAFLCPQREGKKFIKEADAVEQKSNNCLKPKLMDDSEPSDTTIAPTNTSAENI